MASKPPIGDINVITNLSDAINLIKFMKISHKAELNKWIQACMKQSQIIKNLESNRHQELAYLSTQLHKYEFDLLERENNIEKQLADKDKTIDTLNKTIETLQEELSYIQSPSKTSSDSSDSGILVDKYDENTVDEKEKKNRRLSFKSMNIFRNIELSPKTKKAGNTSQVSRKTKTSFRNSKEEHTNNSEDDMSSEDLTEFIVSSSRKLNDSMTNHFCNQPSEMEKEKIFDRVMAQANIRRSVKNSKYQKIRRNKGKYLEGLTYTCEFDDNIS